MIIILYINSNVYIQYDLLMICTKIKQYQTYLDFQRVYIGFRNSFAHV